MEGDVKYDLEPDIFTFNVGKHTGSFIIDNQGKPKLLSGDSLYKIDLKGLTVQEYSTTEAPVSSVIKITAPDGYIYEFGGHLSSLEYFIPNNPKDIDIRPRYITSWHLSSIHAPNQRRIDFGYNSINQPYRYNYFSYYSCIGNAFTTYSTGQVSSNGFGYEDPKRFEMKDDIYVPILRQISIGGEIVILFTMSDRNKFYDDADLPSKGYDKIQYYWNGQEIKSVNFTYVDKDGYFFLESVTDSEQGKYTFQYYHPSTLPSPLTVTTDHWGFWKGNNITHMNRAEIANWSRHVAENREVDTSYCRTNLLKKIVYPTGGFSIVEYEPNARLFGGKPQATGYPSIVRETLSRYDFPSIKEFNTLLNIYNVYAEAIEGEKDGRAYHGVIYGALDEQGERIGVPVKSSRIGKDVGYDSLQRKAADGSERLRKSPAVKRRIMTYAADAARHSLSKEDFIRKMEERDITVFFRESDKGRIYGTTFIDHRAGIVLNGSRLEKVFSSNVFEELFNDPKADRKAIVAKMEDGLQLSVGNEVRRKHDDSPVPWIDIVRDATDALNIFVTGLENQPIPIEEWEDMQEEIIRRKQKKKKQKRI